MTTNAHHTFAPPAHATRPWVLSRGEIVDLDLYAMLLTRTGRGATRLVRDIWRSDIHDPRRLFTSKQRRIVVSRDASCCAYCGRHVTGLGDDRHYIDHVIPHTLGGQTVVDNAVLACGTCNAKKGAKIW